MGDVVAKTRAVQRCPPTRARCDQPLAAADPLARSAPGSAVLTCAVGRPPRPWRRSGLRPVTAARAAGRGRLHRDFDFRAGPGSRAVRGGARSSPPHSDATYPIPGGPPGAGSIVAAIPNRGPARPPEVAGKPSRPMAAIVRKRLGTRGVVWAIGRPPTAAMADVLGWPFALVLSGVTGRSRRPAASACRTRRHRSSVTTWPRSRRASPAASGRLARETLGASDHA